MRTKILTTQIFILFLTSILLIAQDDKSVQDKLEKIKGDINKIVVSTDKGDVVFEGDEAKQLLTKMKAEKLRRKVKWVSEHEHDFDFDADCDNVMILKSDKDRKHIIKKIKGGDKVIMFKHGNLDDLDIIEKDKIVKVEINDESGNKKITVTTTEDGKETVETYEGKEADEYFEKMNDEHEMLIDVNVEVDSNDDHIWIHEGCNDKRIEKNVKVEIEDGIKKVTVTTTENGKKKVDVYEGEEADEILENEHGCKKKIGVKLLKDCNGKKVIIKELKKVKEDKE